MQHDVNQHSVQTGGTFYKYDAAIILTSLLGRGRLPNFAFPDSEHRAAKKIKSKAGFCKKL
jgi:hypothetical protein